MGDIIIEGDVDFRFEIDEDSFDCDNRCIPAPIVVTGICMRPPPIPPIPLPLLPPPCPWGFGPYGIGPWGPCGPYGPY
jgi:hypothetical protein